MIRASKAKIVLKNVLAFVRYLHVSDQNVGGRQDQCPETGRLQWDHVRERTAPELKGSQLRMTYRLVNSPRKS